MERFLLFILFIFPNWKYLWWKYLTVRVKNKKLERLCYDKHYNYKYLRKHKINDFAMLVLRDNYAYYSYGYEIDRWRYVMEIVRNKK